MDISIKFPDVADRSKWHCFIWRLNRKIITNTLTLTKNNVNEYCLNCGTELLDLYCHNCGQKDTPRRQTLIELIKTKTGLFLNIESSFLRNIGYLLFFYLLMSFIPSIGGPLKTGIIFWTFIYLLIAMKRMYQQNWRKTVLKYSLFVFAISFCLLLGVAANFFISLLYL